MVLGNGVVGEGAGYPHPRWLTSAVLLAAAGVLLVRTTRPVLTASAASWLVTCYLLLLHRDLAVQPAFEPFLVMLVAFFALGLNAPRHALLPGLAASALPLTVVELASLSVGRPVGEVLPTLLFWGTALVLGRLLHGMRREASTARERAARAEEEAAAAAATERTRIARELHDVVAHSLSVVVLHAGVERRLLDDPSSTTWQALDTIERTGRSALEELRRLLGLLHEAGDPATLEPLPTLAGLDAVVAPLRSAGHTVTLTVAGELGRLPRGVELSSYRIVQEALTNVLKHAPGAPVTVRLERRSDGLEVVVENGPGPRPPVAVPGGGHGLVGMRERVRVYGGRLDAAPRSDGGFRVAAVLPLAGSHPPSVEAASP
jgi:signal transduction histidine kinase